MAEPQQVLINNGEQVLEAALQTLARALKAIGFYPADHPQRGESIAAASRQLLPLLGDDGLVLLWNKDGCASEADSALASRSATAKMLAREMLKRKVKRLIFLPRLSLNDLNAFLELLVTDEAAIYAAGGIEAEILRLKIGTIGANELDLTTLSGLQESGDESGSAEEATEPEPEVVEDESDHAEQQDISYTIIGMDILLGMMDVERSNSHFQRLAQEAIDDSEELKKWEAYSKLMLVLEALLDIHDDDRRQPSQKESIRNALEHIAGGTMTPFLLDRIEERPPELEKTLDRLCAAIGKNFAHLLVERLSVAEKPHARKAIAIALAQTGEAALPSLIPMLQDERWSVVRNMVTILGEIGSKESIGPLLEAAAHQEPKVRKEAIKALLKINCPEGEQKVIEMIDDNVEEVALQAIGSLGFCRSRAAVRPLLNIATASDPLLRDLNLKKKAVAALGKIGDRQATGPLLELLGVRGWLAPGRWQELKTAAAKALGQLGDESAIPTLKNLAQKSTPLGIACDDAADNLERLLK